jgi:outer membrane protein X
MKKLLLVIALISSYFFVNAQATTYSQVYKAFKVDVGLGYAIPSDGTGTKAGVTFTIEPHYRITDDLAVGLRFEGAGLGYEDQLNDKAKVSLLTSYCPTLEYYLMDDSFRPFVGAGAGLFTQKAIAEADGSGNTVTGPSATKFGVFPRIGFEAGHFRFAASYDVLGNNANYASFGIGAFFGGGRKSSK